MSLLALTCQYLPGGTVIWVAGEVDATNSARLKASLARAHPRPHEPLVLELSALTFLDCSGLGALLNTHAQLEETGGRMLLAAPHQRVRRLLELTGTVRVLPPHADLEKAITAAGLRAAPWAGSAIA